MAKRVRYLEVAGLVVVGVLVAAYAVFRVASNPAADADGLSRFAQGELAKLEVLENPPAQPEIMFVDADGERLTLADFRGKVLVVNLWATWCAPCVREMPSLDRLQAARGSDQLEVVAITVDGSLAAARTYYEEKGIGSLALYQESSMAMATQLGVSGIPITVVYGPGGEELARLSNGAEWDSPDALAFIDTVVAEAFAADGEQGAG
jgi:thiol-disulfide isomerase/thioredoxin